MNDLHSESYQDKDVPNRKLIIFFYIEICRCLLVNPTRQTAYLPDNKNICSDFHKSDITLDQLGELAQLAITMLDKTLLPTAL